MFAMHLNSRRVTPRQLRRALPLLGLLLTVFFSRAATVPEDWELIYDNTSVYLGSYFPEDREYGDEIRLGGTSRTVRQFSFEYFGDFVANGDETARIRFYRNDGHAWPPESLAPGSLLFDSQPFKISPGPQSQTLTDLAVIVPDSFTWTIEFVGLSQTTGDRAGLLLYSPPSVGQSYTDYWWHKSVRSWELRIAAGRAVNFSARIFSQLPTPSVLAVSSADGSTFVRASANPFRRYQLQAVPTPPAASTNWIDIGEPVDVYDTNRVYFTDARANSSGLYRVIELPGEVPPPRSVITSTTATGSTRTIHATSLYAFTYQLERQDEGSTNWVTVGQPVVALGSTIQFRDTNTAPASYRVVYPESIDPIPDFRIGRMTRRNNKSQIDIIGPPGPTYFLQYTTNLMNPNWVTIGSPVTQTLKEAYLPDVQSAGSPRRFYRVGRIFNPRIVDLKHDGQRVTVIATALKGRTYALEYKNNLSAAGWARSALSAVAKGPAVVLPDVSINRTARFYRVVPLDE